MISERIVKPAIFNPFTEISAGMSTRLGGVSNEPYSSLNLGLATEDTHENIWQNRRLFFDELQTPVDQVVFSYQIHGTEILVAEKPGNYEGYDAQITNIAGICLAVSIADCTPILIHDQKNKAIAAIHAGWKGTVGQIVQKTLVKMNESFGTIGANCFAYIGTCIGKTKFEVNNDVAQHFEPKFKKVISETGKFLVDLKEANQAQLLQFGVPLQQIEVSEKCTVLNNDQFFSHRFEKGTTGRMLAAIKLNF